MKEAGHRYMNNKSDRVLLDECRSGDSISYRMLYDRYKDRVFNTKSNYVKNGTI